MKLYIQVENNQPLNHPALENNIIQAFGKIPDNWEEFTRVEKPIPSVYQIFESEIPSYQKVDGVWTDVWPLRDMTAEEKATKQQAARDAFNAREQVENWSAWVFDEATCSMVPPIARPAADPSKINAGIHTFWCGAENNWKDTPPRNIDMNQTKFDFIAWDWIAV